MRAPKFTPWLLVATLTAAGAAAAAGYGLTAPKRYTASARMLVAPVSAGDSTFAGLDVLRDAAGKATAAESAAVLVRSAQIADAVRAQLGLRRSRESLLGDVHADVVGRSEVVEVEVSDTSAASAAQLANGFVDALIAQRTSTFQSQLGSVIRRDTELLAADPGGLQARELARRLAVLRSFQGQSDPTLRRASTAITPTSATWPVLWSLVLIGAGIGLVLGAVGFLLWTILGRRDAPGVPQYSRGMSDHAVNALVERLEQRLAARESGLAARERDLQAKIDELRALEAGAQPATAGDDGRATALAERERALAERVAAVTQRELAVARAAAGAAPEIDPAREAELAERERAVEERERTLAERERAVAQAEADVEAAAAPPVVAVPVVAAPPVAAASPQPAAVGATGYYTLHVLETLVRERGQAFPERRDEWDSTLFFLRDYVTTDGRLPGSFDFLVEDTFGPLLAEPVSDTNKS